MMTAPTLCLGEALVDMIGEAPAASVRAVDRFVPHFGGATANVAVFAARAGASVALAGAAGDDRWGRWLRDRLEAEGVDARHFALLDGVSTQLAFVAVDGPGEPTYELYGELVSRWSDALGGRIDEVVDASAGLFISSNTLAGAAERELTMRARDRAIERRASGGVRLQSAPAPLVLAQRRGRERQCVRPRRVAGARQSDEAELLTGEADPERAALALRKAGAELVVITLGSGGAILRGAGGLRADAAGAPGAR